MIERCEKTTGNHYHRYGGRGIIVCARWKESFWNFFSDMGPRPERYTIERIDNDGNYEPGNCKWATQKEQCANTSKTHIISHDGESKHVTAWAEQLGIKANTIIYRLLRGWAVKDALSTDTSKSHGPRALQKIKDAVENKKKRKRVCLVCGGIFHPRQAQLDVGGGKYCSKRCSIKMATKYRGKKQPLANLIERGIIKA
jgi:hypothetical protein